jgi:hypothetical protein
MNHNLKKYLLLLTAVLALPVTGQTTRDYPFTYLGVEGGMHDLDDWQAIVDLGNNIKFDGHVQTDARAMYGVYLGRLHENYRWEVEYQYGGFDINAIQLNGMSENKQGKGHYQALTLNGYRHLRLSDRWQLNAGLGIGYGSVELPALGFTGGCHCFPAAKESDWLWQGRVELEYRLGIRNALGLRYTWLRNVPVPGSEAVSPGIQYTGQDFDTLALSYHYQF